MTNPETKGDIYDPSLLRFTLDVLYRMPLQVLPCTSQDFPRIIEVEKAAWADDPFTPILFPGPMPPGMAEFRAQEMARQLEDDPTTHWVKVVDTSSQRPDEGVAFANWHIYENGLPKALGSRAFGEGCNVDDCEQVFCGLARQRERHIGDESCVCMVFVHFLRFHLLC